MLALLYGAALSPRAIAAPSPPERVLELPAWHEGDFRDAFQVGDLLSFGDNPDLGSFRVTAVYQHRVELDKVE